MDWGTISAELEKKLDPSFVKPPPQGKYGEYIEGWHAIAEANRIFGFGGWSYTLDKINLTNATEDGGKHRVGYMACVTVTVDGVQRGDVGHGQGFGRSEGDAHDSAAKEAVTDALKRALRTFGNPFGLALYDKSKANVGRDAPPFTVAARDRIVKRYQDATKPEQIDLIRQNESDDITRLYNEDRPKFNEVKKAKDEAMARLGVKETT